MISSDRFLLSKEDPGTGYYPQRQGQNHIQNSHVFILPSATILRRLDSMVGRSLAPGQRPFVNTVYPHAFSSIVKLLTIKCTQLRHGSPV